MSNHRLKSVSTKKYGRAAPICKFRRASNADIEEIRTLITLKTTDFFGPECVDKAIQKCYCSSVAIDANGSIVAVICLHDHPNIPALLPSEWEGWLRQLYGLDMNPQNTLWVHIMGCDPRHTYSFLKPMLESVFVEYPMLINIMLISPGGTINLEFMEDNFTCILPIGYSEPRKVQTLHLTMRHQHIRKYKIRLAVEEDNDDIVPLINNHSTRLKELYGEYYVSEILTKYQHMKRKLIVAEYAGRAIAVLFLNDDVNYSPLIKSFALEAFCNLHKMDTIELEKDFLMVDYSSSLDTTLARISSTRSLFFDAHRVNLNCLYDVTDSAHRSSLDNVDNNILGLDINLEEFSEFELRDSIDDAVVVLKAPSSYLNITKSNRATSVPNKEFMDYKAMMSKTLKLKMPPDAKENAFTLEVIAAGLEHEEAVLSDLLEASFQSFPEKEYCVLAVSSNRPHFPLFNYFVRVIPRRNSTYSQELYVLHRNGTKAKLSLRKIKSKDLTEVEELLISIDKSNIILDDIHESLNDINTDLKSFAFFNENVLIGIVIVRSLWDIEYLNTHYQVHKFVDHRYHRYDKYGLIKHCTFSTIFEKHTQCLLRELHRQSDMTILFHKLHVNETIRNTREKPLSGLLKDMLPVSSNILPEYTNMKFFEIADSKLLIENQIDMFALFISTSRLCSLPRIQINSRLVIVGSSNAGLSFLENLIFHFDNEKHVIYNNLTLVHDHTMRDRLDMSRFTPRMFVYHGKYRPKHFNSVCFRCHVNYVYGFMVAINRKDKYITLDSDTILSYDYLFLMGGQQYHQPYSEGLCKQIQPCPSNVFVVNRHKDAEEAFNKLRKIIRRKTNYTILVYGSSIHAYCCIAVLQKMNIPNSSIIFIEPFPNESERPIVNIFNNSKLYQTIHDIMSKIGIKTYTSYHFHDWELHKRKYIVKKVNFTSRQGMLSLGCNAVFYYGHYDVNYATFTALNAAGLVYDGKLVISPDCRTNDQFIFAAGPMTKYSRKYYADRYLHRYYSSIEIGERLAIQIRAILLPGGLEENDGDPLYEINKVMNMTVPQYKYPLIDSCHLPGGINYLNIRNPGKPQPLERAMNAGDYGTVIETGDLSRNMLDDDPNYFRVHLDCHYTVRQVTCFTKQKIDVHNLIKVWGKHEKMLNNLYIRFKMNIITDLFEYFRQPYFCALYLDTFLYLQEDMNTILQLLTLTSEQESNILEKFNNSAYHKLLVDKIMDFIDQHSTLLPVYAHPVITKLLLHNAEHE